MMKSLRFLLIGCVGAAALFLANARARDTDKAPRADVTITDADDGKTIHIKANQTLEVRLAGNLTTGYAWYAVGGRDNDGKAWGNEEVGVLAPSGEHAYIEDPHEKGVVGSGGTDVYHYMARKPGSETLRFIQLQPWEHGNIGKRESFKIVVD